MTRRPIGFALLREGPSDDGLVPHLRELIVRAGAEEATGGARGVHGTTERKLVQVSGEASVLDIVFVHRDADGPSGQHRIEEIESAARSVALDLVVVPIVPIQELEAWLLTDPNAIREVVGNPNSSTDLEIPRSSQIESTSRPKEVLQQALLAASNTKGRRREKEVKSFSVRRRTLLERLDIDGPVRQLTSWQRLEQDIGQAVREFLDSNVIPD